MTSSLAPSATRAHLPATDEVYVLGPLDAPLLVLNVTDDFGCAWLVDEPEGWDAPEFDTPVDRRSDGDGGFAGQTSYPPRTLTFDGLVSTPGPLAAKRARRRLVTALAAGKVAPLLYSQLDDDPVKSLWTHPTGKVRARIVDGYAVEFSFTLVAENPLKFGTTTVYGPTRLPLGTGLPGRVYPRVYPVRYNVGPAGSADVLSVPNTGDEPADAIYTVTGPVPQPILYLSTGEFVGITEDLAATDVLVIDTRAGTLRKNGVNRADVLVAGSTFPQIPSGGADVRLRSLAGGTSQVAGATVTTAPTWH